MKRLGIENGTMFTLHQNRDQYADKEEYQRDMELLQYDILYGEHYVYDGGNPYPASDLVMGTQDVVVKSVRETEEYFYISGENFTKWSKAFVDDSKVSTGYISSKLLRIDKESLPEGYHKLVVNQMGSSDTIFRSSNTYYYTRVLPAEIEEESETQTEE